MAGPIRIAILANASQATREMNALANTTTSLGSKFASFGKTAAKAAAAGLLIASAAAVKLGVDAVKAASDLNETVSKTEAIFGKAAPGILKFGDAAAKAFGLSKQEALDGVSTFGNFFNQIGIGTKQSVEMSKRWVEMSADLGSFHNEAPVEVMQALTAATRGEYDTLQKFIPTINAAAVQQKAMAMTGKESAEALTDADKAAAVYALTLKGQGKANGDFARTSSSLANQQKILAAQFENIKAKVGGALLPIVLKLVSFIATTALPAFARWGEVLRSALGPVVDKIRDAFGSLLEKLRPVGDWMSENKDTVKTFGIIMGVVAGALLAASLAAAALAVATSPITLTVIAIAALAAGIAYAYNNSEKFRAIVDGIGPALKAAFITTIDFIMAKWAQFGPTILAVINGIVGAIQAFLSVAVPLWKVGFAALADVATVVFTTIKNIVQAALRIIQGVINVVMGVIRGDWDRVWKGLGQIVSGAWNLIKAQVTGAIDLIKAVIRGGLEAIRALWAAGWGVLREVVSRAFDRIKDAVVSGAEKTLAFVKSIPARIVNSLGNLGALLYNAGRDIIQGLLNGIASMFNAVKSKLGELTNLIPKVKGPPAKDKRLLRPTGRMIIQGLIDGFADGVAGVESFLGGLTDLIEKKIKLKDDKAESAREKAIIFGLKDRISALKDLGRAQDKVNEALTKQKDVLRDLKQAAAAYATGIRDSIIATGNITGLGKNEDGTVSLSALLAGLRDKVAQAARFSAVLKQLAASKLSGVALQQLIDAGPDGGLATAEAIAAGGSAAIAEVNSLTGQLVTTGQSLGNAMSTQFHAAGVNAAAALVAGLEKDSAALERAARRLAIKLANAVKQALGIKSPSRVFMEIGDNVMQGLALSLSETRASRLGATAASSLVGGFGTPALSALNSSTSGAAGAAPTTVNINVTAPVGSSKAQIGAEVKSVLDSYYRSGGRDLAIS